MKLFVQKYEEAFMAEIRDFLKKHCLITLIVAEVFALAGIYFIYAEEYFFASLPTQDFYAHLAHYDKRKIRI